MTYEWYKKGSDLLREIRETRLPETMAALWYIGQMGAVVRFKNLTLCFDPVLNDLCNPDGTSRRNYAPPFLPEEFDFADYVICSHNHADHINIQTLLPMQKANPNLRIIVPMPERRGLMEQMYGEQRQTEQGLPEQCLLGARAGQNIPLAEDVVLCPVAAAHETYVTDEQGDQRNLGYVLKCGGINIYHAGDTVVTPQLIQDVRARGPVDLACIPVNGVDTERHSRGIVGNMDCRDGAYFAWQIGADMTLPMHCDMVMGNEENPLIFAEYMRQLYPGRKYHIMQLGERILIGG